MNTTYFLNQVMGNVFGTKTTPSIPSKYYLGLSTTTPNISGGNVSEPSPNGTGYTRVELNNLSEPNNGVIVNDAPVAFPESTANWGTVTHYVVYDSETYGNLLFFGEFELNRTVEKGTAIMIPRDELVIQLTNS